MGQVINLQAAREAQNEARQAEFEASESKKVDRIDFTDGEQKLIRQYIGGPEVNGAETAAVNLEELEEPVTEEEFSDVTEYPIPEGVELAESTAEPKEKIRLFDEEGNYILANDPSNEGAKQARQELIDLGCDMSILDRMDSLGIGLNVSDCENFTSNLIDAKKPNPKPEVTTAEGEKIQRKVESTLIINQSLESTEQAEFRANGYIVRILPSQGQSEDLSIDNTVPEIQVISEFGGNEVYKEKIKPGVATIPRTGENEITVNIQEFDNKHALIELSQKNTDLKALNGSSNLDAERLQAA